MKKWTLALLGATTAFALSSGAAMAYTATIFDTLDVPPPSGSPAYSQGYAGGWHDHYNLGTDNPGSFYSGNFSVTWSGASNENVTLTFFSYMPRAGQDGYGMADIFIKTNTIASDYNASAAVAWDYGLDINSGNSSLDSGFGQQTSGGRVVTGTLGGTGTLARLVADPTYALAGGSHINTTKICTYGGCGGNDDGRNPEVEVTNGSTTDATYNVVTDPAGDTSAPFTYSITLNGVNTDGSWNNLRIFWGTGWCANDTVEGFVARIPVPAALPIIGAALAGFGFAGWRQRKAA